MQYVVASDRHDVAAGAALGAVDFLGTGGRDADRRGGCRGDAKAGLHGAVVRHVAARYRGSAVVQRCRVPQYLDRGRLCGRDSGDLFVCVDVGATGRACVVRSDHLGLVCEVDRRGDGRVAGGHVGPGSECGGQHVGQPGGRFAGTSRIGSGSPGPVWGRVVQQTPFEY